MQDPTSHARFEPGSPAELERFAVLQERLAPLFRRVLPDPLEPRTVVVVPALSLDLDVLSHITALPHYEERLLCMLMLLRLPRTRVIYLTSVPVDPAIVDYYLHLLPGIPGRHARARLRMLTCNDGSLQQTLTEKVLRRPRLVDRLRAAIGDPREAHMTCFNVTPAERTLAVQLDVPIFGCDPLLAHLGSKSGSRKIFREAGIAMADGFEELSSVEDIVAALAELKRRDPELRRAVVKLEEGTSGLGNAVFRFEGCPNAAAHVESWVREELPVRLRFEDVDTNWAAYSAKFARMGGIVEAWIEGETKLSPSVQGRVTPLGEVEILSTHDQVLGGPSGQMFLGCSFPASEEYRLEIQRAGQRVGDVLAANAALGRYGVDFISVKEHGGWKHYAIEINLRKGGTTHIFRILQFLTDGRYDLATGTFLTKSGEARFYRASDNLKNPDYERLSAEDLMDVAVTHRLHFDGASQIGSFFHLIGALSGFGKLGMVCVAASPQQAQALYGRTEAILDREALSPAPMTSVHRFAADHPGE